MRNLKTFDISYTQNRELSWLRFNERVLEEAEDEKVPFYERLKFISIFTSNLAEFFMIRVGSLYDIAQVNKEHRDNKSLLTADEQLERIFAATESLYRKRDDIFAHVESKLRTQGVIRLHFSDLSVMEQRNMMRYFNDSVAPLLSPQIIDFHHPFPHLVNQALYIAVLLKGNKKINLGIIPVPKSLPEVIFLPGKGVRYILLSEIILACVGQVFAMYSLIDKAVICLTRDADINLDDEANEDGEDYPQHVKKVLKMRQRLAPVRLEMETQGDSLMANYLCQRLNIEEKQSYITKTPIHLSYVFGLAEKFSDRQKQQLSYPVFKPVHSFLPVDGVRLIDQVLQKDVLLHYPYESFDGFLRMVKEAAYDEMVVSIKITIYRMGSNRAKLMNYLILAAELGKEVTVIMELRARFDEANNINWSENLSEAGCNIIYGFKDYKIHSKICLITRRADNGVEYITQIGTGNYNSQTAALYTDLSLITANQGIGEDANQFFKNMCLANLSGSYNNLLVAPVSLKPRLLTLIAAETDKVKAGMRGSILMKMNSLTDREIIDALVGAARQGVKIKMIIRGICCLLPNIKDVTDNITVISIVGRFLEHSRVYCFGSGRSMEMYISSADLMTRNTEKRVEIACPVYSAEIKKRIQHILRVMLDDNAKARLLQSDGTYKKRVVRLNRRDCQEYFMEFTLQKQADTAIYKENKPV